MKKSLVAVSIIAVLGAAWSGASWYTGKLIEQQMATVVANANQQLQNKLPDTGFILSIENYRRGIFTSQVRYVLHNEDRAIQAPGDKVVAFATIDHGPFPLNQLTRFNLLPTMASVHAELENTPVINTLFELAKGKSPITSDTRIAYSGDISSVIDMLPLDHQQGEYRLTFSGAKLTLGISHDMKDVRLDFNAGDLDFADKTHSRLVLRGLAWNSDTRKNPFDFRLGTQSLAVKQLQVLTPQTGAVELEGITISSQTDGKDNYLNGQADYRINALKIKGHDLGSGQLRMNFNNVDATVLKAFIDFYNRESINLLQQYEGTRQQLAKLVEHNLPLLLKGYPTLSIAPFSWKNSQGEASFSFTLGLQEALQTGTAASPEQQLTQAIKRLEAHLTIPEAMATETSAQLAQLQGASVQQAQAMAPQQVQGLVAMAQQFNLLTQKDAVIGSSLRYADNQVELNGNKMSLQAFISRFAGGAPVIETAPEQPAQCH